VVQPVASLESGISSKGLEALNLARNNTSKQQLFRNFDKFAFLRYETQVSEIKHLECLEKIISTLLFPDSHSRTIEASRTMNRGF
jgi:hypothetical protein